MAVIPDESELNKVQKLSKLLVLKNDYLNDALNRRAMNRPGIPGTFPSISIVNKDNNLL